MKNSKNICGQEEKVVVKDAIPSQEVKVLVWDSNWKLDKDEIDRKVHVEKAMTMGYDLHRW